MEIVFSTFNARYSHTALALRCLRANLGELHGRSVIIEFDNRLSPQAAAEKLLACRAEIILFSVYIWNLTLITETVLILRAVRPDLKIIIGGPEVSYEYEELILFGLVDHLICGEGELATEKLCRDLLSGKTPPKVIHAQPVDLKTITLPYDEYTEEDIARRRIYVETSRGCPFHCEYCLSALEETVRFIPAARLFPVFGKLIERGARIFKFLDRSFNIHSAHAAAILRYFLENRRDGMMLHLEWEPDHLPAALKELMADAPPGFFQLEVGVQTFNADVARRINRALHAERIEAHLRALAAMPSIHLHADLIAGLPGETLESIAAGFDRLHACGPHEIQLGILKKLRGAPIARHDQEWQMVYNNSPPYNVVQTSTLSFLKLQKIRRFARFWDITVNNGRFPQTAPLLWKNRESVFGAFMEWTEWIFEKTQTTFGFSPQLLAQLLEEFLTERRKWSPAKIRTAVQADLSARSAGFRGMERQARTSRKDSGKNK
ncbi:MAG: B12-binding domain-containing radical SAM protein [Pontiellaceae bacterium]|jgi:hypothetical protein|nr:B12-binding domain-containing radical SAM protein [Pontiellaceae bacterium]